MPSAARVVPLPPDQQERERALDATRCVLVRAPAGSGKTDLLTRRFLRLLAVVDEPGQIIAITFTKAAAAEMRHRILESLEATAASDTAVSDPDDFAMETLAKRALANSRERGWNLLDLPAQLRISTIDAFCRELALQQPLLSGLGGGLEIAEEPRELYRRAAQRTLEAIDSEDPSLGEAIEAVLLQRDNGWQDLENLLIEMLATRDRWMHDFVVARDADWDALRERLERPFRDCVSKAFAELSDLLDQATGAREEILELARFACAQTDGGLHGELAELAEFPSAPFDGAEDLEDARQACVCLATLLLTNDGNLRRQVDKRLGFPSEHKREKDRLLNLIADLRKVPGLEAALASIRTLPPARYTDEDWRIVRACFVLLRHAAGELKVVFAEAGRVDYIEVAQIAESVLKGENEIPSETALAIADGARHLLVDEFQDTSRRQHRLLGRLIGAWAERENRTCFVVGDPMQSIYFFRDADAELFPRMEALGLEIPHDLPLEFDAVRLFANFRTAKPLVVHLNEIFAKVFEEDDESGVTFSRAEPARNERAQSELPILIDRKPRMQLHLEFVPEIERGRSDHAASEKERIAEERTAAHERQIAEVVDIIHTHRTAMEGARAEGRKYRVAVLGRARSVLVPIAEGLRAAAIPFRAVELEQLKERPEVRDALALARALLSPQDRVAWLSALRAPWCGLRLDDLHKLVSADDPDLLERPVPELLVERQALTSHEGRAAVERVLRAVKDAERLRSSQPAASLGTWLEQAWLGLGGAQCVDAAGRANLNLLWRALGGLPEGEQDLLGPALDAALEKLTALPDPAADPDFGVQLMTIHKSKGLEFEVVLVPDLQAGTAYNHAKLLSWLERGLAEPDGSPNGSREPTEFLVAPLQPKGADRGTAKQWVDRVYRARELQEMRRLFYVAATRAREELHLFARPAYKAAQDGSLTLLEPRESLLKTAWPAFEHEIREQFALWCSPAQQPAIVAGIAASGPDPLRTMPAPQQGARLRRLPADFVSARRVSLIASSATAIAGQGQFYERHTGSVSSRALGTAVHSLLEELARLRRSGGWDEARSALPRIEPRIAAQLRAAGIERPEAPRIAAQAREIALAASHDPTGQWILSPQEDAASEVRWAAVLKGNLRTVRIVQVDRVFRGGAQPQTEGSAVWWVIDYKTAHAEGLSPEDALPELRKIFAPQVEAYAQVLRNLHGAETMVRGGLYYPRMLKFDWWEI